MTTHTLLGFSIGLLQSSPRIDNHAIFFRFFFIMEQFFWGKTGKKFNLKETEIERIMMIKRENEGPPSIGKDI